MKKSISIVIIVSLVAIVICLVPSFIYNQLEYEFRMNFSMAMQHEDAADELIAIRQLGKNDSTTDEYFESLATEIEQNLEEAINYSDRAIKKQGNQEFIPLLPTKYKKYHEEKKDLISVHRQLANDFLIIKKNEHLLTDTIQRLFSTQAFFRNYDFENQDLYESIEFLDYNTFRIESQANRLYKANSISSEVYDYLIKQNEPSIHILEQFRVVIENQSWDKFDPSKITNTSTLTDDEVTQLFTKSHESKRTHSLEELRTKRSDHYNNMEKAGMFYIDNHLGYDYLSKLISYFSGKYPLNKEYINSPTIVVPSESGNPDLISLNVYVKAK